MKNLPLASRIYILGVIAGGAVISAGVMVLPGAALQLNLPFLIFLSAALLIQLGGVRVVLAGEESHAYSLLTAALVSTILLFPPSNSLLLVTVTFVAYWFQRRYSWYQGLFNIAQHIIAVGAASVVWQIGGVRSPVGSYEIQWYLAGFATGLTFYVINGLLVTTVISLAARRPFVQVGMLSRASFYRELVLIWLAVLAADFWTKNPLFTVLLTVPLVGLSRMLRIHVEYSERLRLSKVDAEERAAQLASLNELARDLTSSVSRTQIYDALDAAIRKTVKVNVFGMGLLDAAGEQVAFGVWRVREQSLDPFTRGAGEPIMAQLLASPQPVVLDAVRDREAIAALCPPGTLEDDAQVIALPMILGTHTIGLIVLGVSETVHPAQLALISTMASQAAVALEKAELFENLQTQMGALEQAQLQLLQSAKLATIGELAAFIAHEINNPLTSVLGYASLILSETEPADPRRGDLEVIEKEALRARAIVRDLLGYARQTDSIMGQTYVNAALESILPLVKQRAEGQRVSIRTRFEPHLPSIMADVNQLKQVFINFLNNAIDAMPQGGEIVISTRAVTSNGAGPQVEIAFQDSGMGIGPEHLPKIFDPFFTTKKTGLGTGLGLPISKRIVERHGGSIEVASAPGEGTRFTIHLPVSNSS